MGLLFLFYAIHIESSGCSLRLWHNSAPSQCGSNSAINTHTAARYGVCLFFMFSASPPTANHRAISCSPIYARVQAKVAMTTCVYTLCASLNFCRNEFTSIVCIFSSFVSVYPLPSRFAVARCSAIPFRLCFSWPTNRLDHFHANRIQIHGETNEQNERYFTIFYTCMAVRTRKKKGKSSSLLKWFNTHRKPNVAFDF